MWARRTRTAKRNANGVARIKRDSYNTVSGVSVKSGAGWWALVKSVTERSGGRCESRTAGVRCSNRAREVHHIIPLSKGGTNTKSNAIHLCQYHHDLRHNHLFRARTLKKK